MDCKNERGKKGNFNLIEEHAVISEEGVKKRQNDTFLRLSTRSSSKSNCS